MKQSKQNLIQGKYSFEDIVDINTLKEILEQLSEATGFTTGVVTYPEQKVLISTGWRDICARFHRANPDSEKKCKKSNKRLTNINVRSKNYAIKKCELGLIDGYTPVIIDDIQVATLFTGQVLFEEPDRAKFRRQAEEFGYNVDDYMAALDQVPVIKQEDMENILSVLNKIAVMIGEQGLANIRLRDNEKRIKAVFNQTYQFMGILSIDGILLEVNDTALNSINEVRSRVIGKAFWDTPWWESSTEQQTRLKAAISKVKKGDHESFEMVYPVEGKLHYIDFSLRPIRDYNGNIINLLAEGHDITDRKEAEFALKEKEIQYKSFIQHSNEGIYCVEMGEPVPLNLPKEKFIQRVNSTAYIKEVNESLASMYGLIPENMIGEKALSVAPDYGRRVQLILDQEAYRVANVETLDVDKDGNPVFLLESFHGDIENDHLLRIWGVQRNITDLKKVEKERHLDEMRLEALLTLSRMQDDNIQEIADYALEQGVTLTNSEIGFLAFTNENENVLTMHSWSKNALDLNRVPVKPLHYKVEETGMLGEAIRQRKPVIINDYEDHHLAKKGLPKGHITLKRHMTIPVFDSDHIVAVAGVGNKDEDYNDSDVRQLTLLMDGMWKLLQKKKAQDLLAEANRMFSLVIENIPIRVFWKDREGRFLGCNTAFAQDVGFDTPEDLTGKTDYDLIDYETAVRFQTVDSEIMSSGIPKLRYEEFEVRPDGQEQWLQQSKIPIKNEGGEVIGILGVFDDITSRKEVEMALIESETKFRNVVEQSNDAIYILNSDRFDIVNQRFADMFGVSVEQVVDPEFNFIELVDPVSRPLIEKRARMWERGERPPSVFEFLALNKQGVRIHVQASVSDIDYKHEKMTLGILRDVTVQKRLEEQIRQSQKMESIGHLAGGIAHDFNNLLTPIIGNTELAMMRLEENDPLYSDLNEIIKTAESAKELTQQLLAFSRKQIMKFQVCHLNNIIRSFEKILRRTIREDIEIVLDLDEGIAAVNADPVQLEQVLMNLCVNAQQATMGKGKIIIQTGNVSLNNDELENKAELLLGNYIFLSVSDEGIGMDTNTLERVFDPFFTTKDKGKGTGLGLSTAYGIIKQHFGDIKIKSTPGRGTTFTVYLPVSDKEVERYENKLSTDHQLRGSETILVVEDNDVVRKFAVKVLQSYGYEVIESSDPQEVLFKYQTMKDKVDLLLSDVVMPKMNGKELYAELKKHSPGLRVLYMSGYAEDVIAHHGILEEGIQFLPKPFTVEAITAMIRNVLDS